MVIIKTKYLPATNTQGSRIKATADGMSASIAYPYDLDGVEAYHSAVIELKKKHALDWDIDNMGYGVDNEGYYFTFASSRIGV
jgi:hypothetical protein